MIPSQFQPIVNHLWQSTLFAGIVGLLTLALRKNRAQVRYWLWVSASVKFVIPFSLLAMAGSQFGRQTQAPIPQPLTFVIEQVSQPFALPVPVSTVPAAPTSSVDLFPAIPWAVWALGFMFVLSCWWTRSRQIRTALRTASPVHLPIGVKVLSSPGILEPGVFGILRPVLLLPDGILRHLTPAELESILAHELCHVRRRDNLITVVHMAVEAVFWFHPLVWRLGAWLVEERERACDEEVLRRGNKPQVYAESILKVCELYLESPVPFVAGVTGSNLRKRIETIMHNRIALKLNFAKKAVLATAGIAALAAPIVVGIVHAPVILAQSSAQSQPPAVGNVVPAAPAKPSPAPQMIAQQTAPAAPKTPAPQAPVVLDWQTAAGGKMAFEVATVKPGEFVDPSFPLDAGDSFRQTGGRFIANFPVFQLIMFAYKINPAPEQRQRMLAGVPNWFTRDRYTIEGQAAGNPTKDQFRLMMQALLAERFHLEVHWETQQAPVFALELVTPGKLGPNLRPHNEVPPCDPKTSAFARDVFMCGNVGGRRDPKGGGALVGSRNLTMSLLANVLPNISMGQVDRPVVDRTGLSGGFDFTMSSEGPVAVPGLLTPQVQQDLQGPSFRETLRRELGLKLESTTAPVQILLIDHVERPSEN